MSESDAKLVLTVEQQQKRAAGLKFDENNTLSFAELEEVDMTDARAKKNAEVRSSPSKLATLTTLKLLNYKPHP